MPAAAIALDAPLDARSDADADLRFQTLVTRHRPDLQKYAYWLSQDRHTAEDLVQETLLRAWRSLGRLQNPAAAKGWLMTILRRENARRFERYRPQESDIPLEEIGSGYRAYDTSTEAFVLRQALEALPREFREPLILQVVHGYSQSEVASHLGISSAGAGTRLFRARQKLREAMGE